jgi:hypothetical protein
MKAFQVAVCLKDRASIDKISYKKEGFNIFFVQASFIKNNDCL